MSDPQIIITRLRIRNFRGLANLDVPVGPGGAIFSGTNGEGKTTAIDAINAAAEGLGIGPEAIRIGSDKTEILLDLDKIDEARRTKLEVKRTISKSGTKVALTGGDGVPLPKAKEQLAALFGGRALDPLKFYLANAKEQRAIVLAANPVRVTGEDLTRWTGDAKDWNVDGHGQEVLARVRKMYFDQRTDAGRIADQAKVAVEFKAQEVDRLKIENPETMTPEAAQTHVAAAERELAVLFDRRKQAEKREAEGEGTRVKVAELRAGAEDMLDDPSSVTPAAEAIQAAEAEQHAAAEALEEAQKRLASATSKVSELVAKRRTAENIMAKANMMINQANELEAAIAHTLDGDGDPIAMQAAAAEEALEEAKALVARAESAAKWRAAKQSLFEAEAYKAETEDTWKKLNTIVKNLTEIAPAEIAARADLIEGLEVTPDSILLDGKDITLLCGAEKMRFAVNLSKRVAGKAKILTVDGLEQLAPSKRPEFVRMVLEGGWALFATVVADGAMQIIDCYQFAQEAA